jgi:hypothetical protein
MGALAQRQARARGSPGSLGQARPVARDPRAAGLWPLSEGQRTGSALDVAWTPLLDIAAAAVTETSGLFAHAAIVVHELGIPLVDGSAVIVKLSDSAAGS